MELELLKVHGSKNTFYLMEGPDEDWSDLAQELCAADSEADGLLLVAPSEKHDAKMRVFNLDGSEASMCGNGLRCVARYICERDGLEEAVIDTMKAPLHVRREQNLGEGVPTYAVEISPVLFSLDSLPMHIGEQEQWLGRPLPFIEEQIPFYAVAVPNPHLIGIVPPEMQADSTHQEHWASFFNGENPYFPDGVNVSYVTPLEDGIFVRTYERGVGFTNACGTAMTASALVAGLAELVPFGEVNVYNPGGMVKCTVKRQGDRFELELKGNATFVSEHLHQWEPDERKGSFVRTKELHEEAQYEVFSSKAAEKVSVLLAK